MNCFTAAVPSGYIRRIYSSPPSARSEAGPLKSTVAKNTQPAATTSCSPVLNYTGRSHTWDVAYVTV